MGVWNIRITREDFYNDAQEELSDSQFEKRISVQYLGEEGVDSGGVRNDFFSHFFSLCPLFENHTLQYDAEKLRKKEYYHLGNIIATAIVHGHIGPRCLHNSIVDRILGVQGITHVPVEDVKDERGMHFLKAVSLF